MNRQYGAISGVAIALIMLNHAVHFALQVSPVEGRWLNALIVLQALGAFAVPAFLFISGAFLSYAGASWSLKFLRTNLERLLWPYVIWSAVFYALVFVTIGERQSPAGYVRSLFVGYPYHFVPLLVFWYVAAPVLMRAGRRGSAALLVAIGAYQAFLILLRFPVVLGGAAAFPAWVDALKPPVLFVPMSDWAIYFPLGLVLSMHQGAIKPRLLRLRWFFAAAAAALFLLGVLDAFGVVVAPWARFAAPVPLMFLLPVIVRDAIPAWRWFDELGKRSYGIYLAHFAVINMVVFLATRPGVSVDRVWFILIPAFFALELGGALALMALMARAPRARRIYRYVFGIVPPAAPPQRRFA